MRRIILLVGTSVLDNFQKENPRYEGVTDLKDNPYSINSLEDRIGVSTHLSNKYLSNFNKSAFKKLSAEIHSLIAIQEEGTEEIEAFLIASETNESVTAAIIIRDFFNKRSELKVTCYFDEEKDVIQSIKAAYEETEQNAFITEGLDNLLSRIDEIKKQWKGKEQGYLNITSGYKSIIPILTIYGQLVGLPLKYIYEDSNQLISIGNLPINFDMGVLEDVFPYLNYGLEVAESFASMPTKVIDIMCQNGLIQLSEDGKKANKTTLGTLLGKYSNQHFPMRPNILGLYLEVHLYRCFHQDRTFDIGETGNKEFLSISETGKPFYLHKAGIKNVGPFSFNKTEAFTQDGGDVDLMFNDGLYIGEIKPFSQVAFLDEHQHYSKQPKLAKQIVKNLSVMEVHATIKPKGVIYIIHRADFINEADLIKAVKALKTEFYNCLAANNLKSTYTFYPFQYILKWGKVQNLNYNHIFKTIDSVPLKAIDI